MIAERRADLGASLPVVASGARSNRSGFHQLASELQRAAVAPFEGRHLAGISPVRTFESQAIWADPGPVTIVASRGQVLANDGTCIPDWVPSCRALLLRAYRMHRFPPASCFSKRSGQACPQVRNIGARYFVGRSTRSCMYLSGAHHVQNWFCAGAATKTGLLQVNSES